MTLNSVTPDHILEVAQGFRGAKALLSAVELDVFTVLADGPLELEHLSAQLGLNARGARDFLDALVALGMLVRPHNGRYGNSAETDLYLDRNKPTYVGGVLESSNTRLYGVWGTLTTALRTGKPQCEKSAAGNFAPLYADEMLREAFVSSMTAQTRSVAKALAIKFPWQDRSTLIDIGTAQGCLPVEIAHAHPHITGGGFDLALLEASFARYVGEHGLANRLRFYPGDFFNGPLPTADVLVLGRVLHNWDLAAKKMLLKKAYDALPPDGTLIVYERLIDDERCVNAVGLLSSLNMLLTSTGGFDFTGAECIGWMHEIGFRGIRLEPLTTEQSMVVGVK
jgi:SAM-dependent methyltransferase